VIAKRQLRPDLSHLPERFARGPVLGFVRPATAFARKPPTDIVR
jgi:hypothetical protein